MQRERRLVLAVCALISALLMLPGAALALTTGTDPANVKLDGTIKVSPPLIEFESGELAPGKKVSRIITIRNRRTQAVRLKLVPLGAIAPKSGGTVRFVEGKAAANTAAAWIRPERTNVVIPPRGFVQVRVNVVVPANTPPGARYGAIGVRTPAARPAGSSTAVGVESEIAIAVLAVVGPQPAPRISIGEPDAPWIIGSENPWTLSSAAENVGEVHARIAGTATVKSLFGRTALRAKLSTRPLLPGARTKLVVRWKDTPWMGIYRVQLKAGVTQGAALDAGTKLVRGTVQTKSGWLIVLPPWWTLLILLFPWAYRTALRIRRSGELDPAAEWDEDER